MGVIASRQDYDCEANRMLDALTEYLNKIEYASKGKLMKKLYWYGEATNFAKNETKGNEHYYTAIKKKTKQHAWIITENDFIHISTEIGDMFLRAHKIRELKRKISIKE